MDNQHRKISGYRELGPEEIASMNNIKSIASKVGQLVAELEANPALDQRWIKIAKDNLQTGFMQLTRSVAQPTNF